MAQQNTNPIMYVTELIIFLVALYFLARTVLVIAGNVKGPVIRTWQYYGPEEPIYQPIPHFLLWFGLFSLILPSIATIHFPMEAVAFLFIVIAYFLFTNPHIARKYPHIFLRYPRWMYELNARTGRYERRRIAFMWLRLPRRLRAVYNSDDHAFAEWADFVILGTFL